MPFTIVTAKTVKFEGKPDILSGQGERLSMYRRILRQISFGCVVALAIVGAWPVLASETVEILAVNFPPYEFEEPVDGLRGFDVEVTEAALARRNLKAEYRFLPWARAVDIATKGDAAAVLSCAPSPAREASFILSEPISTSSRGYLSLKIRGMPRIETLAEGQGYRVGSVLGYVGTEELLEVGIEPDISPSDEVALLKLKDRRIDYFYTIKEAAFYLAKGKFAPGALEFHEVRTKTYHLCFSKKYPNSQTLVETFNEGLREIRADGTYEAIHSRYR